MCNSIVDRITYVSHERSNDRTNAQRNKAGPTYRGQPENPIQHDERWALQRPSDTRHQTETLVNGARRAVDGRGVCGMTTPYQYAWAWVSALAGDPNTAVMDWRVLHDTDKSLPGHARRGTLPQWWDWLTEHNQRGYGVFATVALMDGEGRELGNVSQVRAHYVDLDNLSAKQNYDLATQAQPAPSFAVNTSGDKHHIYWVVQPYSDNNRFQTVQRKLRQVFDGDRAVIDAARVMRVPGTIHAKGEPHLVTCHALSGFGSPTTVDALEQALAHVVVVDGAAGERHDLGDPELAAPSLDWLRHAMELVDPNDLDRSEWIALTAAFKQAGWSLTDEETLKAVWADWCARYDGNDQAENEKQWKSLRNTELGWHSLVKRVPSLRAAVSFSGVDIKKPAPTAGLAPDTAQSVPPMPEPPALDCGGEYLTHLECEQYFKGCVFVTTLGRILTPDSRLLNQTSFNGEYGGKKFIVDSEGKQVKQAWEAALMSTLYQIPKVDHLRFVPSEEHGTILYDDLGRKGVNTYKPNEPERIQGDVTPFLRHLALLLPDPNDQRILIEWIAHAVKYPGHKIPWAPVIQSTEGAGKGVFKKLMTHAIGKSYVHFPKASEMTSSGSTFNGWMRNKTFILVDEIKVDDKRDLIEILKPLISEEWIEIQSKGVDQELQDNFTNWMFFTNYKDAIPIYRNGRRYAMFYSAIQSKQDKDERGMDDTYFPPLYHWIDYEGGKQIITDWLLKYPIEKGAIPMEAPDTSCKDEALSIGRSPIERVIEEAVEDNIQGFRAGWISTVAAANRIKTLGAIKGSPPPHVLGQVIESLGYTLCGRANRLYFNEDRDHRTTLYHRNGAVDVSNYGMDQGYGVE